MYPRPLKANATTSTASGTRTRTGGADLDILVSFADEIPTAARQSTIPAEQQMALAA